MDCSRTNAGRTMICSTKKSTPGFNFSGICNFVGGSLNPGCKKKKNTKTKNPLFIWVGGMTDFVHLVEGFSHIVHKNICIYFFNKIYRSFVSNVCLFLYLSVCVFFQHKRKCEPLGINLFTSANNIRYIKKIYVPHSKSKISLGE